MCVCTQCMFSSFECHNSGFPVCKCKQNIKVGFSSPDAVRILHVLANTFKYGLQKMTNGFSFLCGRNMAWKCTGRSKIHIHGLVNAPAPWQHARTVQPCVFPLDHCSLLELKLADR